MSESHFRPQLQAWGLFLRAHSAITDHLERELLAGCQLPLSWYDVLIQIRNAPDERLRLQDLGQSVVLSKSGLSRRIDRMEARGLVRRELCPNDARGVFAVLTDEGRGALERAAPLHLQSIEAHFGRYLSDEEGRLLRTIFQRILKGETSPAPCVSEGSCTGD
jgi:DNA-binding MarR family transcriptional regulator